MTPSLKGKAIIPLRLPEVNGFPEVYLKSTVYD